MHRKTSSQKKKVGIRHYRRYSMLGSLAHIPRSREAPFPTPLVPALPAPGVSPPNQQHLSPLHTPQLPPDPGPPHNVVKLVLLDPPLDADPAVPLEHHVAQQVVGDVLPQQGGDAPQVGDGDGPAGAVGEERVGLVELAGVGGGRVVARVELEGADGEEGVVLGEAFRVRVEDGDELGQLVLFGGDAEGTVCGRRPVSL